jgi:diguanylate cyclase (GGDEF)-like protein
VSATIADGAPREAEVFLRHRDGHRVPVRVRTSPIRDGDGRVIGVVETFSEDTALQRERRRAEVLEALALSDPLTSLPNRRALSGELESQLVKHARLGIPVGVLMLDVDDFKKVNDEHGHEVGDRGLVLVAETLANATRRFEIVGRWGGEEFLAIIPCPSVDVLREIGERLRRLIASCSLPIRGGEIRLTVSVGAAMAEEGDSAEDLVRRADERLYAAKRGGRNRVE